MASVHLKNLNKRYGVVKAVIDLTLDCDQGEMLALLGPSGCGKSSTLKMIAGVEDITSGEIWFDDRMVADFAPGQRNIAMVFEDYSLYPHMTVFDNIAFPLKIRHTDRATIKSKVGEVLGLLDLEDMANEGVRNLSGGAQQRIAIGRALVRDPDLILFDEPLSHLDADQKVQLRTEIKRLQQVQGLTSILVTHDQTEATAMADRIAVMDYGVLQQVAAPQTLYDHPANRFVASFIGEPPMNLIDGRARDDGGCMVVESVGLRLELDDELGGRLRRNMAQPDIVLGVRPEHLELSPGREDEGEPGVLPSEVFFREPRGDADVLLLDLPRANGATSDLMDDTVGRIQAEISGPAAIRAGDPVTLRVPERHVNVFDADSGVNLLLPDGL
jgi:ABC-type sugar transport system ATPase subunit